jgi:hypothetical protein
MASTRRSRKHAKWGGQALGQRERVVDNPGPACVNKAVPTRQRQKFPARRAELAAKFASLSADTRTARAGEFRVQLRKICASDLEFRGFWSLKFEPLLGPGAPVARQLPRRQRAPVAIARDAAVEAEVLRLVASQPGVMSQKTCAQVLAGSASPNLRAGGLHDVEHFGRFASMDRPTLKAHVAATLERGVIARDNGGMLWPA